MKVTNYTIVDVVQGNYDSVFERLILTDLTYVLKGHGIFPGIYVHTRSRHLVNKGSSRVLYFNDYSIMEQETLFYISNISFVIRFFNITGLGGFFLKEIKCYVHVKQLYVDATQITIDLTFISLTALRALFFKFLIKRPLISYVDIGFQNLKKRLKSA